MNIVHSGVILSVYLFIIVIGFVVLSGPFDTVITSFEDLNMTESDTQVEAASPNLRLVFNMVFVGLAIVPCVWFVIWTFSREPDWRYRM